jgi:hypothetical protein
VAIAPSFLLVTNSNSPDIPETEINLLYSIAAMCLIYWRKLLKNTQFSFFKLPLFYLKFSLCQVLNSLEMKKEKK